MSLLKVEQETIILFNEAEATASVYTHNAALQRVLLELCQTHPAQVRQTETGFGRDEPAQSGTQAIHLIIQGGMGCLCRSSF